MAQSTTRNSKGFSGTLAAIGLFLLAKGKWILGLLKFTKFGGMFISMFVSLGAYAVFFGWKFALVLIYLLFVHESGHLIAARMKGMKTSPAFFIPFLGAAIAMKEKPKDAATEAFLAYGGPLFGMIAFLPAVPLYSATGSSVWLLMIYLGALLNLFNLLPVSPLDGGRIVSVLSTKIWLLGLLAFIPLFYYLHSPILILVFLFGVFTWWSRARETYRADVMRYQLQQEEQYQGDLQQIVQEMFYSQADGEGGTEQVLSSDVRLFHLRESRRQLEDLQATLNGMSSFYVPFLQDEKKLKKEQLHIDYDFEHKKINMLSNDHLDYEGYQNKVAQSEKEAARIREELTHMKDYYKAPAATKWKVLILYVALAAVLAYFYIQAQQGINDVMNIRR